MRLFNHVDHFKILAFRRLVVLPEATQALIGLLPAILVLLRAFLVHFGDFIAIHILNSFDLAALGSFLKLVLGDQVF